MIKVKCKDDSNRPDDFTDVKKWLVEGMEYTIVRVAYSVPSESYSVQLNEIDMSDVYPYYGWFKLDRFEIKPEDVKELKNIAAATKEELEAEEIDLNKLINNKKMETYKFIKELYTDWEDVPIHAISEDRIEELRLSETYDMHGLTVGTYLTGDWVELLTDKAVKVANELVKEMDLDYNFSLNDIVNGYDHVDIFDDLETALVSNCDDVDYDLEFTTCKGFNYFDGSNWKTVIVSVDNDICNCSHELIEDKEYECELNNAIENKEWVKEGFGKKEFEYDKFKIIQSQCVSDFSAYQIEER